MQPSSALALLIFLFYCQPLSAQTIPGTLTFRMVKAKATIGTSIQEPAATPTCMRVNKRGNDITFLLCNTDKAERSFRIVEIEKETRYPDMYVIQYFGFEYFDNDPVPSFLSYSYEYGIGKWTVMLENVHDKPTLSPFRHLSIYFNY